MASRLERTMLSRGTFNGPVDRAMIAYAKKQQYNACRNLKHEPNPDGWEDWIPFSRKWFIHECATGCVKPFNERAVQNV